MSDQPENNNQTPRIVVRPDAAYRVYGNVPLVHKTQVVSEYGEPLTWRKDFEYEVRIKEGKDYYSLCRCGASANMPFCDNAHREIEFDGRETAGAGLSRTRSYPIPRGKGISVRKDPQLCMNSGYCGLRDASLSQLVAETGEPRVRALVMAMVERCPSGSLTYRIEPGGEDVEPDLPVQIAVTTEITSEGPIRGPLWVTGGIPVERSDGESFETRNRVTLCNCGHSRLKPLCDGAHRRLQEQELREKKTLGENSDPGGLFP